MVKECEANPVLFTLLLIIVLPVTFFLQVRNKWNNFSSFLLGVKKSCSIEFIQLPGVTNWCTVECSYHRSYACPNFTHTVKNKNLSRAWVSTLSIKTGILKIIYFYWKELNLACIVLCKICLVTEHSIIAIHQKYYCIGMRAWQLVCLLFFEVLIRQLICATLTVTCGTINL